MRYYDFVDEQKTSGADTKSNNSQQFNFTESEWSGIVDSGNAAAGISFAANSVVLILHAFMTWYRPAIVNRLSLRMIVLSCIFNIFYCACQLVTDNMPSTSFNCRVLAYILIASDTMACMCLAMVGLNLVMIFVLKVSRSLKLELLYYFFILLSGVLVIVVPYKWGTIKGPKSGDTDFSCWYHYYFDGRINNIFNWMWYYGWLLFSLVFAALCAAISIRFVLRKQENFASTLDMYSRRNKPEASTLNTLKRYANNNSDVFQKIAQRCVCYPLIPFFSKSWGVGIEIAASQEAYIPYPIFVLDRIFSCLLGFMVSCVYFTDPAIGAVFRESKEAIKKKYVYDYYCVKYKPGTDPSIQPKSQYPQVVRVVPNTENNNSNIFINQMRPTFIEEENDGDDLEANPAAMSTTGGDTFIDPLDVSYIHSHMSSTPQQQGSVSPLTTHKPGVPTMEVHKTHPRSRRPSEATTTAGLGGQSSSAATSSSKQYDRRRYSVISVTSTNGKVFLPNDVIMDNATERRTGFMDIFKESRHHVTTIPMRRVSRDDLKKYPNAAANVIMQHHPHGGFTQHADVVETLVPFQWPKMAKFIHWTLVSIFKVRPVGRSDSDAQDLLNDELVCKFKGKYCSEKSGGTGQPTRVFRDYTDSSEPGTPPLLPIIATSPSSAGSIQSPILTGTRDPSSAVSFKDVSNESSDVRLSKQVASTELLSASQSSLLKVSPLLIPKPRARSIGADSSYYPTSPLALSMTSATSSAGGHSGPTHTSPYSPGSAGNKKSLMRRVSTINVASLQRGHVKELTGTPPVRPIGYLERRPSSSTSSSSNKLVNTLGLAKMWPRKGSIQFNWGKFGSSRGGGTGNESTSYTSGGLAAAVSTSKKKKASSLLATPTLGTSPLRRESTSVLRRESSSTVAQQQVKNDSMIGLGVTSGGPGNSSGCELFIKRAIEQPIDKNAFLDTDDEDNNGIEKETKKQEASSTQEEESIVHRPEAVAVPSGLAMISPFPIELSPRPISQYRKQSLKKRVRHVSTSSDLKSSVPIRTPIQKSRGSGTEKRLSLFAGDDGKRKSVAASTTAAAGKGSDEDVDPLTSLMELFDGKNNALSEEEDSSSSSGNGVRPTADDILQPVRASAYTSLTPTEEKTRPVSLVSELSKASSSKKSYSSTSPPPPPFAQAMKERGVHQQEGFKESYTTIDFISNWQIEPTEDETRITILSEPWDIEKQLKLQMKMAEDIAHM